MATCEQCRAEVKELYEIIVKGKTTVVCLLCRDKLDKPQSLGRGIIVKTHQPSDRGGLVE